MIIECPACTTRYDIKAVLPPEGRTVRCAKCATVWRAMPEIPAAEAEPAELSWAAHAPSSADRSFDKSSDNRSGGDRFAPGTQSFDQERAADSAVASGSPEQDAGEQAPEEEAREEAKPEHSPLSGEDGDGGKVRWFSSFRRKKKPKEESASEDAASAGARQATAETIPFPRANELQAQAGKDARTLDEARQAVRGVFSSLGDSWASVSARAHSPAAVPAAAEGEADHEAGSFAAARDPEKLWGGQTDADGGSVEAGDFRHWASRALSPHEWATGSPGDVKTGSWQSAEGEREDDQTPRAGSGWPEVEDKASGEEQIDPDAALRDAMRAHFPPPSAGRAHSSSFSAGMLSQTLETHFRAKAAQATGTAARDDKKPANDLAGPWGKLPSGADEGMGTPAPVVEELAEEETGESKDGEPEFDPRLYREIEETREISFAGPGSRRGSLVLAAGWGLFLSVAGGLVISFFVFRDIAADAVPGLAPLYRALGMPVTVQPLVFESVQYRWTLSENKPALAISGSVFNRAHRKVKVPEFSITIKDADPALDRDYSANLQVDGSKIRSNQRAGFNIELLSPNPTVTSVELELRNVH